MKFSDPYTDNSRAVDLAASLKLESAGGRSPVRRLRETPRLDLVKKVLGPNLEALGRGRELFRLRPGIGGPARRRANRRGRASSTTFKPNRADLARWATPCTACWRRIAASRSPA